MGTEARVELERMVDFYFSRLSIKAGQALSEGGGAFSTPMAQPAPFAEYVN